MKTLQISARMAIVALLTLSFSQQYLNAQSGLSNLGFENWTAGNLSPSVPAGWEGSIITRLTNGPHGGSSYVSISNTTSNNAIYYGTFFLGSPSLKPGGIPFTQKLLALNGFFKSSGLVANDTVGMYVLLTKQQSLTAVGHLRIGSNNSAWTPFSIPVSYVGPAMSDTLRIYATSGKLSLSVPNSSTAVFELDDLSLSISTGLMDLSAYPVATFFPNPVSEELTLRLNLQAENAALNVYDLSGKLVCSFHLSNGSNSIDLRAFDCGVYLCETAQYGAVLQRNKLIVIRQQ
jgi:hypothetical protein